MAIENARAPKFLYGPIAVLRVEPHKAALLDVRQDPPTHHGCDGAHAALKMCRDFALRLPMDELMRMVVIIHGFLVWRAFKLTHAVE
jgi:hypothetical protein